MVAVAQQCYCLQQQRYPRVHGGMLVNLVISQPVLHQLCLRVVQGVIPRASRGAALAALLQQPTTSTSEAIIWGDATCSVLLALVTGVSTLEAVRGAAAGVVCTLM